MAQGGIWLTLEEAKQLGYDLPCLWYQMHPDQRYGPWTERQRNQVYKYADFFSGTDYGEVNPGLEANWPKSSMEDQRHAAEKHE